MKHLRIFMLVVLCALAGLSSATNYKKVVGGDISMLTKYFDAGSIYYDANGNRLSTAPQLLAYFKDNGLNSMRVRIFVDPTQASSDDISSGVCQDLDYVKVLGKQIKDAGLNFLLDFHYSDTWTDPGQHSTPASWNSTDPSVLANYLYNYTKDVLEDLVAYGATPDDIQIGNEVTVGMLWPTGKCYADGTSITTGSVTGKMANFALYLAKGAKACREVCPNAKLIIHTELSSNGWGAKTLYKTLKNYPDVDYDIIGLSYYPYYHGNLAALESVINSLEVSNPDKPIQIVEAGYYYKWQTQSASFDYSSTYPISETGQKAFTDDLITMLNGHDNVNGLYWWWLEANEYGKQGNVTTNWYCASLWNNETGYPTPAFFSLRNFIDEENNVQPDPLGIHAYFINDIGWSKVNAYANVWDEVNSVETVYSQAWPGTMMTKTTQHVEGTSGDVYLWNCDKEVTSIQNIPQQIEFNNDGWEEGNQSEMLGFLNGGYYRFYQNGGEYVSECYQLILPDGAGLNDHSTDFWCRKWVQPVKVGYERQFTASQPSTLCLPFALTADEVAAAGKFYKLSDYKDGKLVFKAVTTTDAYTPYLFIPASSGKPFASLGNKEIDVTTLVGVEGGSATMNGVMERTSLTTDESVVVYGYKESDGTFVKVKTGNVNPFRAYITVPATEAAGNTLAVEFDDSQGVRELSVEPVATVRYDVMGRRVSEDAKGIIISNGKKTLIK